MLRCAVLAVLATPLAAGALSAQPMQLSDPTPRWVSVSFEISPRDLPGQTRTHFSRSFPAWLEPGAADHTARVTVDGRVVERHLLFDDDPVPESFSHFVWVFDTRTGHVRSASVAGTVRKPVDWGFFRTEVETDITIEMNTESPAGFRRSQRILGHELFRFCDRPGDDRCTLVEPARYDPGTGYVNAVGEVEVQTGFVTTHSFSPLGEAVFSELGAEQDFAQSAQSAEEPAAKASVALPSVSSRGSP